MILRHGIQFHWKNRDGGGYEDFEAFLTELSHDKRKKIRQERRKVHAEGIRFQWLSGYDASRMIIGGSLSTATIKLTAITIPCRTSIWNSFCGSGKACRKMYC